MINSRLSFTDVCRSMSSGLAWPELPMVSFWNCVLCVPNKNFSSSGQQLIFAAILPSMPQVSLVLDEFLLDSISWSLIQSSKACFTQRYTFFPLSYFLDVHVDVCIKSYMGSPCISFSCDVSSYAALSTKFLRYFPS